MFKLRQPLALHALCAVGGIVAADSLLPETVVRLWPWIAALALALAAASIHPRFRRATPWLATLALFFAWHGYLLTGGPGPALAKLLPEDGYVAQAVGVVDEEPAPDARFRFRLESVTINGQSIPTTAIVLVRWKGDPFHYGDRLNLIGDLHRLAPPRNPGVFDSPKIYQRQGITCELRVRYLNDAKLLGTRCGSPWVARAYALRRHMEATMALDLEDSPELVEMIQSMVLGSRGESLAETRKLFQYTGTMHLFAVSGMNVAMLATISMGLLQALGVRRHITICLVIPLLWIYCYATGLTASSLRATVMATLVLAGFLLDRPALSWNTLGAATLLLLAWDPGQFFTPGFQLSFGMVAFLMAVAAPLQQWLNRFAQPDPFLPRLLWPRWLVFRCRVQQKGMEMLAVSIIAWIGSMPLTLYFFNLWSPSTIPANLFAVGLAWIMLVLGLASVVAGTVSPWLAIIFNNANWLAAKLLLMGITALASLPWGHFYVEKPLLKAAPVCEVTVLDIPGGAAIHLRTHPGGQRDWLIDCGSATAFKYTVTPYLRSRGVNDLDGLVLTHGDAQHLGGVTELLREFHPAEVLDSPLPDRSSYRRATHLALESSSKGKGILVRGDALTLAPGIVLHNLFPPADLRASSADDKALVLRLDAGGRRFLFTSDAGFLTESWLLEHAGADELRCDFLIKQMHGRDFSGTPEFLKAARPRLIVASGTRFPPQEQIREEWAAEVEALGIVLLRQDRTGAVRITVNAQGVWQAAPFLKEPTRK